MKLRDLPTLMLMAFVIVSIAFQACQTCQSDEGADVTQGPS